MKRVYADLHLCPDLRMEKQVKQMIAKASQLGYGLIAVPLPQNISREKIKQLEESCEEGGIDFVSRVDLKPKTSRELIKSLRKLRRRFEIVAVICKSKKVARQAAKDRRVDLLNFPSYFSRERFFDKAEARLASDALTCMEIDLKKLLVSEGRERIRLLSCLRREMDIARKFHIPIIISSGVSDPLLMRRPLDMAALASLFDLAKLSSTQAISTNPLTIVKRNRRKLSPRFIAPGVHLIRRGKDCQ